jgi:hypothetical protein
MAHDGASDLGGSAARPEETQFLVRCPRLGLYDSEGAAGNCGLGAGTTRCENQREALHTKGS